MVCDLEFWLLMRTQRRRSPLLVATAVVASLASVVVWALPSAGIQRGSDCTIVGDRHRNHLRGTPGNDVICGMGGNDTIHARSGDDIVIGGPGTDQMWGGGGRISSLEGKGSIRPVEEPAWTDCWAKGDATPSSKETVETTSCVAAPHQTGA